jgi:hypothetical protein
MKDHQSQSGIVALAFTLGKEQYGIHPDSAGNPQLRP